MASPSLRRSTEGDALRALEHRISELEHLADAQSRELRIQFEPFSASSPQRRGGCPTTRCRTVSPPVTHNQMQLTPMTVSMASGRYEGVVDTFV